MTENSHDLERQVNSDKEKLRELERELDRKEDEAERKKAESQRAESEAAELKEKVGSLRRDIGQNEIKLATARQEEARKQAEKK